MSLRKRTSELDSDYIKYGEKDGKNTWMKRNFGMLGWKPLVVIIGIVFMFVSVFHRGGHTVHQIHTAVKIRPSELLSSVLGKEEDNSFVQEVTINNDAMDAPPDLDSLADMDEEELPSPNTVKAIEKEYNISMNMDYYSLDELKGIIGLQCSPYRHCAFSKKYFLKGGSWMGDDLDVFYPHDCWWYQFSGMEGWVEPYQNHRVAIFLDGDDEDRSVFQKAASLNAEFFNYLRADLPKTLEDEISISEQISEILTTSASVDPRVTIITNWINPGKEIDLSLVMLRIGQRLSAKSVNVVWMSQPFHSREEVDQVVPLNQAMGNQIRRINENGSTSKIVKRNSISKVDNNTPKSKLLVQFGDIKDELSEYVLFDVRNDYDRPSDDAIKVPYLEENGIKLKLQNIENGWTPNLHFDQKIIVFCRKGILALKAVKLLRKYGFKNAYSLQGGLTAIKAEAGEGSPPSIQLFGGTILTFMDLFAPSLMAPPDVDNPGSSSLLAIYMKNTILNYMFKDQIMHLSKNPETHVCQSEKDCTDCWMVPSRVPSNRLTFELMAGYFTKHATPTIITLADDQKVWDGTWVTFLKENMDKTLRVRRDYSTVASRKFETQTLAKYLVEARILKKDSTTGNYEEISAQDPDEDLPVYAGNNKLTMNGMNSFNFRYPVWFNRKSLEKPAMWLGPRGSLSALHVDHTNQGNLAYQVLGVKKWHLFAPRCVPLVYAKKIGPVTWSRMGDPEKYNEKKSQKMPLFKLALAESMIIDVKQGEMLYNPDLWWHVVYNTESSLMLNFWMRPGKLEKGKSLNN